MAYLHILLLPSILPKINFYLLGFVLGPHWKYLKYSGNILSILSINISSSAKILFHTSTNWKYKYKVLQTLPIKCPTEPD